MIETDNDWCMKNTIVLIVHEELERFVDSLSITEKMEFMILTPEKVVAQVQIETPARQGFVIETSSAQSMIRYDRIYTPKYLAHKRKNKDQAKRLISEAEAEEFLRKMQPKDIQL